MLDYEMLTSRSDILIDFVIHVVPTVDTSRMDEADLDDQGNCTRTGGYLVSVDPGDCGAMRAKSGALEIFTWLGRVSDPNDYRILVSTFDAEMDRDILEDLGAWCPAREDDPPYSPLV